MTDLEFVRDLAERAGVLALAASRTLTREYKADHSLVTQIDRGVEAMIRRELEQRFPGDAFYGEEFGGDPLASDRLWIVDPIDGTVNMVFGLPVWGVSIGLAVEGRPELGVFYLPRTQESFWFERGAGAYRNGERLHAADSGELHPEDPIGIGSEAILRLDLARFFCRQRNFGSLAAHWCYAAAGSLRVNISLHDRLHDLGAAWGVATEAGCAIEYLDGGAASFETFLREPLNRRPLLVGPPETVARVRELFRTPDHSHSR